MKLNSLKTIIAEFDIFIIVALLCIISLVSLHSASYTPSGLISKDFAKLQLVWLMLSLVVAYFVLIYGYQKCLDKAYILFAISIILLLLVFVIGKTRLGARRWINLGFFSLQPAELCKVTFILALIRYVTDNQYKLGNIFGFSMALLITFIPFALIMLQPDLGTALTFVAIFFVVLFTVGARKRYLLSMIFGAIIFSPFLWSLLKPYQKSRVLVFLDPGKDPLGAGYTVIQSKIAIGSGGIIGKGWMAGTQNQLNFLPERHTDFIFSVIGEEWGFFGAVLVLMLFLMLFIRLFRISEYTTDLAGRLIAMATITLLGFQVVVNIAMVMGLMPTVGLPLPLVTYGGSNLIATIFLIALAKSVKQRRKMF